jgi:hypothetical protein
MVTGDMEAERALGCALPAATPGFAGVLLESPARVGSLSLEVDSTRTARMARQMTAIAMNAWGLGSLVADVQVCVSELIGNVFLHAVPDSRFGWPPPLAGLAWLAVRGSSGRGLHAADAAHR